MLFTPKTKTLVASQTQNNDQIHVTVADLINGKAKKKQSEKQSHSVEDGALVTIAMVIIERETEGLLASNQKAL